MQDDLAAAKVCDCIAMGTYEDIICILYYPLFSPLGSREQGLAGVCVDIRLPMLDGRSTPLFR